MCHWLEEQQDQVIPKSPMGQAIGYTLNHWEALTRYTSHGFLAIDNNAAEREMKKIATGRKNCSFWGAIRAARPRPCSSAWCPVVSGTGSTRVSTGDCLQRGKWIAGARIVCKRYAWVLQTTL